MSGTKALALEQHCRERGVSFCRFDYRGHGSSTGEVVQYTVSDWFRDASDMLEHVFPPEKNNDRLILVG
eukprot:CAMPEP_0194366394 /NCGR_PEP_ID=MMETSP0174-20130528/14438_1 /TAXON_ID=216777 /ORGANISM="Proboscia alata, Strain PI-D3" /LENGTH=68 /DNA_ID=CAMNT_0039141561 /DNA_START=39 /DNA_END=242 /DNA_ORIENTATION=-